MKVYELPTLVELYSFIKSDNDVTDDAPLLYLLVEGTSTPASVIFDIRNTPESRLATITCPSLLSYPQ